MCQESWLRTAGEAFLSHLPDPSGSSDACDSMCLSSAACGTMHAIAPGSKQLSRTCCPRQSARCPAAACSVCAEARRRDPGRHQCCTASAAACHQPAPVSATIPCLTADTVHLRHARHDRIQSLHGACSLQTMNILWERMAAHTSVCQHCLGLRQLAASSRRLCSQAVRAVIRLARLPRDVAGRRGSKRVRRQG